MLRGLILSAMIILIGLFGFVFWSLYLIEIEDHYGNIQEVYFNSESGDLVVNKETGRFGIISKKWKRVDVITQQNDTLDLYNLIYINEKEGKYELFRSNSKLNLYKLNLKKIHELESKKALKIINRN